MLYFLFDVCKIMAYSARNLLIMLFTCDLIFQAFHPLARKPAYTRLNLQFSSLDLAMNCVSHQAM